MSSHFPLKTFKANKHLKTKHEQLRARGEKYRKGRSCRQSTAQMPTANRQVSKVTVQATGESSEVLERQKSKDLDSSVPSAFPGTENDLWLHSREERSEKSNSIPISFEKTASAPFCEVFLVSACLPKWRSGQSSLPMPAYTTRVRIPGSDSGMLSPETGEVQQDAKKLRVHCSGGNWHADRNPSCPQWGTGDGSMATALDASSQEGLNGNSNHTKQYRAPSTLKYKP